MAGYTALGIGISFALFSTIRAFAKGSPSTMNKEYQEATNEYLRVSLSFFFLSFFFLLRLSSRVFRAGKYGLGGRGGGDIPDFSC